MSGKFQQSEVFFRVGFRIEQELVFMAFVNL